MQFGAASCLPQCRLKPHSEGSPAPLSAGKEPGSSQLPPSHPELWEKVLLLLELPRCSCRGAQGGWGGQEQLPALAQGWAGKPARISVLSPLAAPKGQSSGQDRHCQQQGTAGGRGQGLGTVGRVWGAARARAGPWLALALLLCCWGDLSQPSRQNLGPAAPLPLSP